MYAINKKRGLIRTIVLIIAAIFLLSYFGFDLQRAVESTQTQRNFGYVKAVVVTVWERYLKTPAAYLWDIFVHLIWQPLIRVLQHNADSTSTNEDAGLNLKSPFL